MKIYDETKTFIIEEPDMDLGYIKEDVLTTEHPEIPEVKEVGHYETIATYDNGGKDVQWIVEVEGQQGVEAWTEEEEICVYIKYTDEELETMALTKQLNEALTELSSSDYKILKYFEGELDEAEYNIIKEERQELRVLIRTLEDSLEGR